VSASKIVGLDLSLTSTGVAGRGWADRIRPGSRDGIERLHWIRGRMLEFTIGAELVVIEGPSYGSKGGYQHERGGLWWLAAWTLACHDTPYAVATPGQLKKYATGRGGADKDEVLAAAVRRFPDVNITKNDEADAYWLCAMGHDLLGDPLADMPKVNREALVKVAMPMAVSA
jgi:crossover junction endodeoxyribonuclease RuvC